MTPGYRLPPNLAAQETVVRYCGWCGLGVSHPRHVGRVCVIDGKTREIVVKEKKEKRT